jgi:hypothetical protein
MSSVTENLLPNEEVVFESSKHWISPIRASLVAAALVLGALVVSALLPAAGGGFLDPLWGLVGLIRWAVLIGALGWIAYNVVVWRTARFAVTNLRVLRYEGLVQRRTSETLLSAVSDVRLRVGFLGSRLDFGDLQIFTQSGAAGADTFEAIRAAPAFRNAMMNQKIEDQLARRAPAPQPVAPAPVAPPAPTADDHAARLVTLADLRDRGVISDAEFEAKKAEILERI